jgi:hypothetical protein
LAYADDVNLLGENIDAIRTRIDYWWESQRERGHYKGQDEGGLIILRRILERWDGMVWTGLVWLRIGTSGGLLCLR